MGVGTVKCIKQFMVMGKQLAGSIGLKHLRNNYAVSDRIAKTHFRNSCWKERCVTLSIKHRGVVKGGT